MPKPLIGAFLGRTNGRVPARTIQDGADTPLAGFELEVQRSDRSVALVQLGPMPTYVLKLDEAQINGLLDGINVLSYAEGSYRNVKTNPVWRQLYQYKMRTLPYVVGTTEVSTMPPESSFPCSDCGIILPEKLTSVDHKKPQSGGEIHAVCKVFRALGMTSLGASGTKGALVSRLGALHMQMGVSFGRDFSGLVPEVPTAPGRARGTRGVTAEKLQRYTLNDVGRSIYTLAAAAGALDKVYSRCVHSFLNLRPVCPNCNSRKGDWM